MEFHLKLKLTHDLAGVQVLLVLVRGMIEMLIDLWFRYQLENFDCDGNCGLSEWILFALFFYWAFGLFAPIWGNLTILPTLVSKVLK